MEPHGSSVSATSISSGDSGASELSAEVASQSVKLRRLRRKSSFHAGLGSLRELRKRAVRSSMYAITEFGSPMGTSEPETEAEEEESSPARADSGGERPSFTLSRSSRHRRRALAFLAPPQRNWGLLRGRSDMRLPTLRDIALLVQRRGMARARDKDGHTLVHLAARHGMEREVLAALRKGTDVRARSVDGSTAFHIAVQHGHVHVADALLRNGAHVDEQDSKGRTALHMAVDLRSHLLCLFLLDMGAKLTVRDERGRTPLMQLCCGRRPVEPELLKLLIDRGSALAERSNSGYTPLHYACRFGNVALVGELLQRGASMSARADGGLTPLMLAVKHSFTTVSALLLQSGAAADACADNGDTLLHLLARRSFRAEHSLRLLLDAGLDINCRNGLGRTPLQACAAIGGRPDTMRLLLENGADVGPLDEDGRTALHLVALSGDDECMDVLLSADPDCDVLDESGSLPLHYAAGRTSVDCSRLAKATKTIDVVSAAGFTPLHIAAGMDRLPLVQSLVKRGADVNARTLKGNTPLHVACFQGHRRIVELLLESGSDSTLVNHSGATASMMSQFWQDGDSLLSGADAARRRSKRKTMAKEDLGLTAAARVDRVVKASVSTSLLEQLADMARSPGDGTALRRRPQLKSLTLDDSSKPATAGSPGTSAALTGFLRSPPRSPLQSGKEPAAGGGSSSGSGGGGGGGGGGSGGGGDAKGKRKAAGRRRLAPLPKRPPRWVKSSKRVREEQWRKNATLRKEGATRRRLNAMMQQRLTMKQLWEDADVKAMLA